MVMLAQNVIKKYSRNDKEFVVVDNFSLELKKHELICVTGSSGSGKTTLLNILAGLVKPDSGSVEYFTSNNQSKQNALSNGTVAYIAQGMELLENFTVKENVLMPSLLRGINKGVNVRGALEQVGLADMANSYPGELSGGERKRVAIARALYMKSDVIIGDEPTANLDFENAEVIMKLFRDICNSGTSVIISTHDERLLHYASRVIAINAA